MKIVLSFLGLILVAFIILTLGSGLLVLLAYGIGWTVNLVMGLEPFQATVLGLAGILVFIILADRVIHTLTPPAPVSNDIEFDDEDDFEDDEDFDPFEDKDELDKRYAGIPRWRRPLRNLDFSNVNPNDRCPCGSGRKYKNCHGVKQNKN